MQRVVILGSTGSIGRQTVDVVLRHPGRWQVVGLAANRDTARLITQARLLRPAVVALADPGAAVRVRDELVPLGIHVLTGVEGVIEVAGHPDADGVVAGIAGMAGLKPTLAALTAGHQVALANKESLVVGGTLIRQELLRQKRIGTETDALCRWDSTTPIIPVDSEHSAIFQALAGSGRCESGRSSGMIRRLLLTASGGPFRGMSSEALAKVKVEDALHHPTWSMGRMITVDSALLMNKALEVIEAHFLFGTDYDLINVVVHPQSIVHSLVEFKDGAVLAQLGLPDMRTAIQLALAFPFRLSSPAPFLDLVATGALTFENPDRVTFPSLDLGYSAGRKGGSAPAVLNAAKEEAVATFLRGDLPFAAIPDVVGEVLALHDVDPEPTLDSLFAADAWARQETRRRLERWIAE